MTRPAIEVADIARAKRRQFFQRYRSSLSYQQVKAYGAVVRWELDNKNWYVYAQPPFGGPEHVLRYLGRYTHRMAISNHRLTAFDGERVSFRWRDYAHGGKQRVMTLDAVKFLRRFFLHVLPRGFVRIRHYGLLSNRFRNRLLPLAHTLLAADGRQHPSLPPTPNCELWHCPRCGSPMRVIQRFTPAQLYLATFDSS